jgi:lysophospholipase L1-like esterase
MGISKGNEWMPSCKCLPPVLCVFVLHVLLSLAPLSAEAFNPHYDPIRIMPLGDSITLGIGDEQLQGYRASLYRDLVKKGYDIDFVGLYQDGAGETVFDPDHQGTGGQTKEELADAVQKYLQGNPADMILLHIGTNRESSDPSPVESILNTIDLLDPNTKVMVARIINKYSKDGTLLPVIGQYNDNVEAMVLAREDENLTIVDMESRLQFPAHYAGTIHPNRAGYRIMADAWLEALLTTLPEPQGITSYWRMEQAVGEVHRDSKLLNPGSCFSGCPVPAPGRVGEGQLFSAATMIEVAPDDTFRWNPGDDFSIELWFNNEGALVAEKEVLFATILDQSFELMLGLKDAGQKNAVFFSITNTANPRETISITSNNRFLDGEWHHVALVRTTKKNSWKLYFDGTEDNEYVGSISYALNLSPKLTLGSKVLSSTIDTSSQFHGILDEIAIYNRVVTGDEILIHYENGFSGEGYYYRGQTHPHIRGIEDATVRVGQRFTYAVQAVGRPSPEHRLLNGPAGMTINRSSGVIDWQPREPGNFLVEIEARNQVGSASRSFSISASDLDPSNGSNGSIGTSGSGCVLGIGTAFGAELLLLLFLLLVHRSGRSRRINGTRSRK